jgi:predicted dehydrogenase/uncharacterized protein YbjT (DUF2867 family)
MVPGADRIVVGQLPYDVPLEAFDGCDAVMHGAAVTTAGAAAESEAVNLAGTRHLLRLAKEAGLPGRFVFLSTQSVFSPSDSAYAVTKRACEAAIRESGLRFAILRPGLVFGPGPTGLFARMRRTVERLPVLPLLGGGRALVQGIEVGDLCTAILASAVMPGDHPMELNLGDPDGVTLAEFLQAASVAATGRRKLAVNIPLWPVKLAVTIGEALRLPLPISRDNIRGMETVQRMETAPSLEWLGMSLPPLSESMVRAVGPMPEPSASVLARTQKPVRIMLVGAGKIGIVHTLSLTRRSGVEFVGIVDRNPGAFGLYKGLGLKVPFETDLNRAVENWKPDGAVVATPAGTHLALTRELVRRNIGVLVEKPVAISAEGLAGFRQLLAESGPEGPPIHAGYMAAQYPHLRHAATMLDKGHDNWGLGPVRRVTGLALQSHIMAAKPVRWEMIRAQSGGGALINFAGHLLTMLERLFGRAVKCDTALWSIHSTEVEDAGVARMAYGSGYDGFEVRLAFSWSIPGYATPENRLIIECENGVLDLRNSGLALVRNGRTEEWITQRHTAVGYNPGPDYTGAGFASEHQNFARALGLWKHGPQAAGWSETDPLASWCGMGPVRLQEAVEFEEGLQQMYAAARGPDQARDLVLAGAGDGPGLRVLAPVVEQLLAMKRSGDAK